MTYDVDWALKTTYFPTGSHWCYDLRCWLTVTCPTGLSYKVDRALETNFLLICLFGLPGNDLRVWLGIKKKTHSNLLTYPLGRPDMTYDIEWAF